ncbi:MAG TPA: hypothetical protein DCF33_05845 [Saprospirales bacterium]|nr:hypothetical protein [Saprospirales bacterium]
MANSALAATMQAQQSNSVIQLGVQYGPTPFETMDGLGFSAGYELDFGPSFSAAVVAGFVRDGYNVTGSSKGQDAQGSWDNQYSYRLREQFSYLDITGLLNLTPNSSRNRLEVGLGVGMTHTMLRYPKDLYIDKGILTNLDYTRHQEWVPMAHLTISNRVRVMDRLELFARLTGRQAFQTTPVLERVVRFNNVSFSSSNNVKNNFTLSIGIGYFLTRKSGQE